MADPVSRLLRRAARRTAFVALRMLARSTGVRHAPALGKALGELEYRLAWRRRRQCERDMTLALGRAPEGPAVAATLRRAHHISGQTALEILALLDRPAESVAALELVLEGSEHLHAARSAGRGAILLGSHAGNGVLLLARLAADGWPVSVVYRQALMVPEGFLGDGLARFGLDPILANDGMRAYRRMHDALRAGGFVFVTLDQGVKRSRDGVPVRFLGKTMSMAAGPAQLALRTGAPVLPVFATGYDGAWRLRVEPPLRLDGATLQAAVATLAHATERHVLAHPELWTWHHRRWRKQPFAHATIAGGQEGDQRAVPR